MSQVFAVYRYFVFALFIACNIGILVVAARGIPLALALGDGSMVEVDAFLLALGSVGLAFTFPILLVDALRKQTVIRHVWFECFWVGIFCLLQLSSAGVVTLTVSGVDSCVVGMTKKGRIVLGPCVDSPLLMAFTWAAAADCLVYLLALTVIAFIHQRDDPLIWKAYVSQYSWFAVRRSLGSEPPTPSLPVQSVPKSGQSEFSNRMVAVRRDTDPEKQAPATSLLAPPQSARRPGLEKSQKSPSWAPRQLQLSASVPLSPKTAKAIQSRRAETPPGVPVNRTYVPATRPRESKKVLRLHRPPSLDLSRISPPR
ncbi:uncharacterized protein B0H18DRAFT_977564 [Fomitopsis serialis]|uniref:uncharacterized protein n=1 Tax=Fomitopsis serialis TaxID=139415 RepID=UPI002007763B|nr:uncharacterized protein B0H18DRAFT_977564 [Neoantrodia serialis]KAH9934653.1 hypothetical protein B0H18DRAFT_977564 [Neoantrodia serialis]